MIYLESLGIVHSDIKPENLVIDHKCRLIIADFGFSVQLKNQKGSMLKLHRLVGSEDYNSPEIN